jgi:hypothetical protein
MQRVKHFAEEEVGQRVVAYGARVESQLQARRGVPGTPGGPAAGSGAVASSEKPGRRRAGKGPATLPESEPVPGDGARLGASRDHTDLFTRLRATAIFIRETEAAARAADAREASARNGEDPDGDGDGASSSSPPRDERASTAANEDHRDTSKTELCGSTLAIVASAEALRVTKRAVEHSLLPQYKAFADSLSAAAAKANAAALDRRHARGRRFGVRRAGGRRDAPGDAVTRRDGASAVFKKTKNGTRPRERHQLERHGKRARRRRQEERRRRARASLAKVFRASSKPRAIASGLCSSGTKPRRLCRSNVC